MKRILAILVVLAALLFAPDFINTAIGQPPPPPPEVPEMPIDGGLTALLMAGMFYGARKLRAEKE